MPQNVVTATDPTDHSRMRKMLANSFSEKTLQGQELVIESYMDLAMARFRAMAIASNTQNTGVVLNMLDWANYFTIDVIGDLGFGDSFNCLRDSQYHDWVRTLHFFLKGMAFAAATRFYPSIEYVFFALLPRRIIQMQKRHTEFAKERIIRRLNMEVDRPDFITPIMKDNADFKKMSIEEIQSNAAILMVAGSEATMTTMIGMMTYLIRNPEPLRKLTAEIRATFKKEENITIAATKELPYLNASINEALRLCNPVPGGLPRTVGDGGYTICNLFVPEHVSHHLTRCEDTVILLLHRSRISVLTYVIRRPRSPSVLGSSFAAHVISTAPMRSFPSAGYLSTKDDPQNTPMTISKLAIPSASAGPIAWVDT